MISATFRNRLRALLHRRRLEGDLDAEIAFHRAMSAEHGSPYRFGNDLRVREQAREAWLFAWAEDLGRDLRYAVRSLRRDPGFAAAVVIVLALGIGVNSAIFGLAYAVLWQPLPYPGANRIVAVRQRHGASPSMMNSPADIEAARKQNTGLTDWSLYRADDATLTGAGEPTLLAGAELEAGALRVLGAKPIAGRLLLPRDDHPGAAPAVMIGARLWRRRWGSNPRLIGQPIRLDGKAFTVVGVLPDWFRFPASPLSAPDLRPSYWRAWQQAPQGFGARNVRAIARLAPGVRLADAQRRVNAVMAHIASAHKVDQGWRFAVIPMRTVVTGGSATPLRMLLAIAGLVLLIAAANIACLLSARAQRRWPELATRSALGASRGHVMRQLGTETALLMAVGTGAGLALACAGIAWLRAAAPASMPRLDHVAMSWPVVAYTAGTAALVMLVFGLAPVWATSGDAFAASSHRQPMDGTVRPRARGAWVTGQVALALLLLAGAALLLTSLIRKRSVPLGFSTGHALAFSLGMPPMRYPKRADRQRFLLAVRTHLTALPGIQSVAVASELPFLGGVGVDYTLPGQKQKSQFDESRDIGFNPVSDGYFSAMQIPLLAGRGISGDDTAAAAPVTVINQAAARALFPGQDPIGKRIRYNWGSSRWCTIVGVVGNIRPYLARHPMPAPALAYVPLAQSTIVWPSMFVLVRGQGRAPTVLPEIRTAVARLDPSMPVAMPQTLAGVYGQALAQPRFRAWVAGAFALLALALTAVGIFGVLAFVVGGRTREFGVRSALGAQPRQVLAIAMRQALCWIGVGIAIGLGLAIVLTRFLAALLYGVSPTNGWILGGSAALIAAVGLAAAWGPARRAMSVDPVRALRCE